MVKFYDYSEVPMLKTGWNIDDYDGEEYYEIEVDNKGIMYYGYDWTHPSGGGHIAGFQTIDEFFNEGPIENMPQNITEIIGNHLLKFRKKNGVRLVLYHSSELQKHFLRGIFLNLDGTPVKIDVRENIPLKPLYEIFRGSIPYGEHELSLMFQFKEKEKLKESDLILNVKGKFKFFIQPPSNQEKKFELVTFMNGNDKIEMRLFER